MKRILLCILLSCCVYGMAQSEKVTEFTIHKIAATDTVYTTTTDFEKQRIIQDDLKEKYSGKDFEYKEEQLKKKPVQKPREQSKFAGDFVTFIASAFPYILGLIVIFIVIRSFIDVESDFWKFKRSDTKIHRAILTEDEDNIEENDFNALLQNALKAKNYRLATRYYYLALLQKMTQKEYIKYHKEKTNGDYLFELKDEQFRKDFSYASYIYNYVWYGEFPIDKTQFSMIQKKYEQFIKTI